MQHPGNRNHAADRLHITRRAYALSTNPAVVYLDTETTGLYQDAEIVDIAIVDNMGRVLLDTLVRPQDPIPPSATAIHGITNAMVANAPQWSAVFPALDRVLRNRIVVIYNAEYDTRMINQVCQRARMRPYDFDWRCAMLAYAMFHGEINPTYGEYRWQKLGPTLTRLGLDHGLDAHRAYTDAEGTRRLVHYMASQNVEF